MRLSVSLPNAVICSLPICNHQEAWTDQGSSKQRKEGAKLKRLVVSKEKLGCHGVRMKDLVTVDLIKVDCDGRLVKKQQPHAVTTGDVQVRNE